MNSKLGSLLKELVDFKKKTGKCSDISLNGRARYSTLTRANYETYIAVFVLLKVKNLNKLGLLIE
jgi:hypothetical protein